MMAAIELERAAEFIISETDWNRVAKHVASNRSPRAFRDGVERVLRNGVDGLAWDCDDDGDDDDDGRVDCFEKGEDGKEKEDVKKEGDV